MVRRRGNKRSANGRGRRNRAPGSKVRRVRLNPRMRVSTIPAAVNTASSIRATQAKSAMLVSNTDRLIQLTLPKGASKGSNIYDQVITPSIAARLRTQASLFQKIRYSKLEFEVQTQTPTTNSGGYVVAFLHDPQMEIGTGEGALRALTAVQGTRTSKFWQSTVMNVATTSQEYFTLNGQDIRLFSPGRFVVLSDGPPTEDVSITIIFRWTVHLTRPALQRPIARFPQAVVTASCLFSEDATGLKYFNWNPATNAKVPPQNNTTTAYHMQNAISGLPPLATAGNNVFWYRLPSPIGVLVALGQLRRAFFVSFRVATDTDGAIYYRGQLHEMPSDLGENIINSGSPLDHMLVQGTRLDPIVPDEFSGNADEVFLVTASPSVSVNQQPMISKQYQTLKRSNSVPSLSNREAILEQLSRMHQQEL
uniref:RNA-dependent RNA polymerase n=2 Tax=Orthornavirae TaxID=2732396 RepID=A0A8F5RB47_9VIRU|nr:MAG: RNA-dependent RNA polymerase [Grapevine-associated bunya-like virus 2]QXN75417.1 MAG: hypothetical protein [Grapevine-associated noda-like virus 2]